MSVTDFRSWRRDLNANKLLVMSPIRVRSKSLEYHSWLIQECIFVVPTEQLPNYSLIFESQMFELQKIPFQKLSSLNCSPPLMW